MTITNIDTRYIEQLNTRIQKVNSDIQRKRGSYEQAQKSYLEKIAEYKNIYGVDLNASNIEEEYNKEFQSILKLVQESELQLERIENGTFEPDQSLLKDLQGVLKTQDVVSPSKPLEEVPTQQIETPVTPVSESVEKTGTPNRMSAILQSTKSQTQQSPDPSKYNAPKPIVEPEETYYDVDSSPQTLGVESSQQKQTSEPSIPPTAPSNNKDIFGQVTGFMDNLKTQPSSQQDANAPLTSGFGSKPEEQLRTFSTPSWSTKPVESLGTQPQQTGVEPDSDRAIKDTFGQVFGGNGLNQ